MWSVKTVFSDPRSEKSKNIGLLRAVAGHVAALIVQDLSARTETIISNVVCSTFTSFSKESMPS
jgi:delta 1-pyrroline-5-carboxylate dehydrogenase